MMAPAHLQVVVNVTPDDASDLSLEQLHQSTRKVCCGLPSGVVFCRSKSQLLISSYRNKGKLTSGRFQILPDVFQWIIFKHLFLVCCCVQYQLLLYFTDRLDSLRITMFGKIIRSTKFSNVLCASNNDLWLPILTTTAKKPKDLLTSYTDCHQ